MIIEWSTLNCIHLFLDNVHSLLLSSICICIFFGVLCNFRFLLGVLTHDNMTFELMMDSPYCTVRSQDSPKPGHIIFFTSTFYASLSYQ